MEYMEQASEKKASSQSATRWPAEPEGRTVRMLTSDSNGRASSTGRRALCARNRWRE